MSVSIQTNYASMVAQGNLAKNQAFQTTTIQKLTSGYRINSSGDDAAGLAVANGYRSNVAELTQGVLNANNGVSQLQIVDGGLNNISNILDRLKTLATESASSTFTGDRTTLNNEYQSLLQEVDRQAANVGLNAGGTNNAALTVYLGGGGAVQANSQVTIDLSGTGNQVDSHGLGLANSNLLGAGTDFNTGDLRNSANILQQQGATETLTFYTPGNGTAHTATITSSTAAGVSVTEAISQLNSTLSGYGISASIDSTNGKLMLSGNGAYTASLATASGGGSLVAGASAIDNTAMNTAVPTGAMTAITGSDTEALTFTTATGGTKTITLDSTSGASVSTAVTALNTGLNSLGIYAVANAAGNVEFQSAAAFTIGNVGTANGVYASATTTANSVAPSTNGTATGNALSAVTAVQNAVATLGLVQGKVGAGENTLQYAIDLANSQITNLSSAQSQLRDADVAKEAANLTKAQVLQQASIAAMAQANSAPQQVLKLLQ